MLFAGVVCFAVASMTPLVLYKLMPTVEGAVAAAGIAGGWGRGAMTGMYGLSTMKNLGGSPRTPRRPSPYRRRSGARGRGSTGANRGASQEQARRRPDPGPGRRSRAQERWPPR